MRRAPGEALADFHIFKLIAEYWGCGEMFRDWESPEAVFQILKRLSAGQPCDITGIDDYAMLDERGGIQWPYPGRRAADAGARSAGSSPTAGSTTPTAAHASSARRRGRCPSRPIDKYPFMLLTGRGSAVAVAHANAHRQVGRAAQAVRRTSCTSRSIRRTPRDSAFARAICVSVASQRGRVHGRALVTPGRPAGAGLHPDALRHDESAHPRCVRSLLAPTRVQGLRRGRGIDLNDSSARAIAVICILYTRRYRLCAASNLRTSEVARSVQESFADLGETGANATQASSAMQRAKFLAGNSLSRKSP